MTSTLDTLPKETNATPNQPATQPGSTTALTRQAALLRAAQARSGVQISWPSKGVDYYAFLDSNAFTTTFARPKDWGRGTDSYSLNSSGEMQQGNLQIAENDIGFTSHTGRYVWDLLLNGASVVSQYAEIAPSTGNLGSSTMGDMLSTPSQFGPGWAISYGFYDSGPGYGGLTNQDQSYVYATGDMAGWMGALAAEMGNSLNNCPFSAFVLPGAHDSGMFDPTCVADLLIDGVFLNILAQALDISPKVLDSLATPIIMRSVIDLAFTQKDTIATMLNLGVRYFDFRPGYIYDGLVGGVYHQHNFIPGYPFQAFLSDVVEWLNRNTSEVVVISPNFQGFAQTTMKLTPDAVQALIDAAMEGANNFTQGTKSDLSSSYSTLANGDQANNILPCRLIVLPQTGSAEDATKYDSYNDSYETANVSPILTALNGMNIQGQEQCDYTVLQLQGTATGIGGGIFTSIATMSNASSPLMSTKPGFDNATYTWALSNVPTNLSPGGLVVLLNDFCDNALASVAASLTRTRANALASRS